MDFDVALLPRAVDPESLKGRTVVLVDVLCAGTVVATALANGARAVIPAADSGDAGRLSASIGRDLSLLGGERGGQPVAGYAATASPLDYTPEAIDGRTVVLTTSNGTPAMRWASPATRLVVASFVNAAAVAAEVRRALDADEPVSILCAGTGGRIAIEDVLCAGLLVGRAVAPDVRSGLGDGAQIAHALYLGSQERLAQVLFGADQTRRLIEAGRADDVAACARIDALDVLPIVRDNRITVG